MNAERVGESPDWATTAKKSTQKIPTPVIDLPLGATEDRVTGALDIERALVNGEKAFQPGLLAKADQGVLYVDEVNLLADNLVDLLLDVSASGVNRIERNVEPIETGDVGKLRGVVLE